MPTLELSIDALDKHIEALCNRHAHDIDLHVTTILGIFKAGREAYKNGSDIEQAVINTITKYQLTS